MAEADVLPEALPDHLADGRARRRRARARLRAARGAGHRPQGGRRDPPRQPRSRAVRDAAGVHFEGGDGTAPLRTDRWADDAVEVTAWTLLSILAASTRPRAPPPRGRTVAARAARRRRAVEQHARHRGLRRVPHALGRGRRQDAGAVPVVVSINGLPLTAAPGDAARRASTAPRPRPGRDGACPGPRSPSPRTSPQGTVTAALRFTETGARHRPGRRGVQGRTRVDAARGEGDARAARHVRARPVHRDRALRRAARGGRDRHRAAGPRSGHGREPASRRASSPSATSLGPCRASPVKEAAKADHGEARDDRTVFFVTDLRRRHARLPPSDARGPRRVLHGAARPGIVDVRALGARKRARRGARDAARDGAGGAGNQGGDK